MSLSEASDWPLSCDQIPNALASGDAAPARALEYRRRLCAQSFLREHAQEAENDLSWAAREIPR